MITSTTWIGLSRIIRLIILNTPTRLSLSADILPKRASKSEVSESSFRRRRITEKIILVATICSFSTRTIGHPKRFQLHLTTPTTISGANWTTMNWEKWSKRSRLCNLASWRGRLAIGNGEGQEIFPGECWHHVRLLILFHRQLRSHPLCSSSGRPQFPCPIYHSLLPPPLATKLNADKETWEAAAITSMRGACSTNWNYCPINAGKPAPQAPPSSDVPTPSINPSPSAPLSQTLFVIDEGPICWATRYRQNFFQSKSARALGRPSPRISSGGVHDEAEVCGHRSIWCQPCRSSTS